VKLVIVLAVDNEVKELLFWLCTKEVEAKIRCVNIRADSEQVLDYNLAEKQMEFCHYGEVAKYLYEPNAAIMKAGAYNLLCKKFRLKKLNVNTHLYTSELLINDFPGRKFKVIATTSYHRRKVAAILSTSKANISLRNFPDTPEQVKKKLALKDGSEQYLFGYRDVNNDLRITISEKI
jgi:hypothetical protein